MASVRVRKKNQGSTQQPNQNGADSFAVPDDTRSYLEQVAAKKRLMAIADTEPFQTYAHHLFDATGADVGQACIKAKNKIVAKATGEYGGDINSVGDVLRMKVTCDSVEQLEQIRAVLWRQQEIAASDQQQPNPSKPSTPQIDSVHDYFAEPINHGYRAINVKVKMPDGLKAEIQITHRALEDAYDYTHKPYDAMRRLTHQVDTEQGGIFNDDQARRYGKLVTTIAQTYDSVSEEHGLDRLLSPKGQEKVAKRKVWMAKFAAEPRTADAEQTLPPWKNKKTSPEESLSERLMKLGFEIEKMGEATPPPIADAYADLATKAQAQFNALPAEEQAAIRGLLTRRNTKDGTTPDALAPTAPVLKK